MILFVGLIDWELTMPKQVFHGTIYYSPQFNWIRGRGLFVANQCLLSWYPLVRWCPIFTGRINTRTLTPRNMYICTWFRLSSCLISCVEFDTILQMKWILFGCSINCLHVLNLNFRRRINMYSDVSLHTLWESHCNKIGISNNLFIAGLIVCKKC